MIHRKTFRWYLSFEPRRPAPSDEAFLRRPGVKQEVARFLESVNGEEQMIWVEDIQIVRELTPFCCGTTEYKVILVFNGPNIS